MKRRSWLVVASVLGVAAALFAMPVRQAGADILVDHFTAVQGPVYSPSLPSGNWSFSGSGVAWTMTATLDALSGSLSETGLANVLGGTRFSQLNVTAIPNDDDTVEARFGVSTAMTRGFLFLDSNVDADVVYRYDAGGQLNRDLSNAISIDLVFDTTDLGVDVTVTLKSNNGAQSASLNDSLPGPGTLSFLISDFLAANNLLNLLDIDSIEVAINTPTAGDFTLDQINIPERLIPEPASLLIWSVLGVAGVFYGRRRWMS